MSRRDIRQPVPLQHLDLLVIGTVNLRIIKLESCRFGDFGVSCQSWEHRGVENECETISYKYEHVCVVPWRWANDQI